MRRMAFPLAAMQDLPVGKAGPLVDRWGKWALLAVES